MIRIFPVLLTWNSELFWLICVDFCCLIYRLKLLSCNLLSFHSSLSSHMQSLYHLLHNLYFSILVHIKAMKESTLKAEGGFIYPLSFFTEDPIWKREKERQQVPLKSLECLSFPVKIHWHLTDESRAVIQQKGCQIWHKKKYKACTLPCYKRPKD